MERKKKRRNKRRSSGIVVPVNPLTISSSGMSADGKLMPPAIHSSPVSEDTIEVEDVSDIRWIPIKKDAH
jgi:hypothetical protein